MTKAPTAREKSKKQSDNLRNATKSFDYTAIADFNQFWVTIANQLV